MQGWLKLLIQYLPAGTLLPVEIRTEVPSPKAGPTSEVHVSPQPQAIAPRTETDSHEL